MKWFTTREGRKWLYGVATAAVPLAVLYGAIRPEDAPAWLALLAALLGVAAPTMALTHLTPKEETDDGSTQ